MNKGQLLIIALLLNLAVLCGCAGLGKLAVDGVAAVSAAGELLRALDGFYGDLVALKNSPETRIKATRALTMADAAADTLRQATAGVMVTDAGLNLAAGQVDGARAILTEVDPWRK